MSCVSKSLFFCTSSKMRKWNLSRYNLMLTFKIAACIENFQPKTLTKHMHTLINIYKLSCLFWEAFRNTEESWLQTHLENVERNLSETNYGNEMSIFTDQCEGVPSEDCTDHLKDLSSCLLGFSSKVHCLMWDIINSTGIKDQSPVHCPWTSPALFYLQFAFTWE